MSSVSRQLKRRRARNRAMMKNAKPWRLPTEWLQFAAIMLGVVAVGMTSFVIFSVFVGLALGLITW
jgi:hypothetical protein